MGFGLKILREEKIMKGISSLKPQPDVILFRKKVLVNYKPKS